jgi:hypothetical protein
MPAPDQPLPERWFSTFVQVRDPSDGVTIEGFEVRRDDGHFEYTADGTVTSGTLTKGELGQLSGAMARYMSDGDPTDNFISFPILDLTPERMGLTLDPTAATPFLKDSSLGGVTFYRADDAQDIAQINFIEQTLFAIAANHGFDLSV